MMMNCGPEEPRNEDDEHADELLAVANRFNTAAVRMGDFGSKDAECVGPGLVWLHVVCACKAGWLYC